VAKHVLIVEDSELVVGALRVLLEAKGFVVSAAGTRASAIETLERVRPDLVLLDLTLPDGSGLDVVRAGGSPGTRFIAMTGHDDALTEAECRAAGCAEVLIKPVPSKRLLEALGDA
jgi:DNA-binding response OmpR family regulator